MGAFSGQFASLARVLSGVSESRRAAAPSYGRNTLAAPAGPNGSLFPFAGVPLSKGHSTSRAAISTEGAPGQGSQVAPTRWRDLPRRSLPAPRCPPADRNPQDNGPG